MRRRLYLRRGMCGAERAAWHLLRAAAWLFEVCMAFLLGLLWFAWIAGMDMPQWWPL